MALKVSLFARFDNGGPEVTWTKGVDAMRNYALMVMCGVMISGASASAQFPGGFPEYPTPPSPPQVPAWPRAPGAPNGYRPDMPPVIAPPDPRLPLGQMPPAIPTYQSAGPQNAT